MARSNVRTLLPLDTYARVMGMPGWSFNQCRHPSRQGHGVCTEEILQSGYYGDPNRILGRDEIAQAIATAEQNIASLLGFWPAPKWICEEEHIWPVPKRGPATRIPGFNLKWGKIISGGVETFDFITESDVVYSDEDGDTYTDFATITVGSLYSMYDDDINSDCEVVIVPHGYDPRFYEIRPVDVDLAADGTTTITGYKWLFVRPEVWQESTEYIPLQDDDNFVESVDVYRHYNKESHQARIVWKGKDLDSEDCIACGEVAQNACIRIEDRRNSIVYPVPGIYSGEKWARDDFAYYDFPTHARFWYYAGYDSDSCMDCTQMSASMQQAIVRLANVYMPEKPCGCDPTSERWDRDTEDVEGMDYVIAGTRRAFGSIARGAVFAYSIVTNSLGAIGKGG